MDFSSINNTFFHFMYKVADLMILSVLWVLASAPLVTIPTASSALYYSVWKVIREDRAPAVKTYFSAFRDNWRQGLALTGVVLGIFALASLMGSAVYALAGSAGLLTSIYTSYVAVVLAVLAWLHYAVSYIAKFQAPLKTVLKNSFAICIANLPLSLSMVALFGVAMGGWLLFLPASSLFLLLLPGVYTWVTSFLLEKIYQKYI